RQYPLSFRVECFSSPQRKVADAVRETSHSSTRLRSHLRNGRRRRPSPDAKDLRGPTSETIFSAEPLRVRRPADSGKIDTGTGDESADLPRLPCIERQEWRDGLPHPNHPNGPFNTRFRRRGTGEGALPP